ncbi:hypothetical protein KPH14_005922 [Odynerus spinipes]|uniref:DUF4777 domain-containing protein n=1 Tax=Odynerus spinipes TaxID=1348599 RepID=A0AAD9RJA4_9HYME|nr:hypothetical protein KPH14_005922 [Odynerus spinipes]
MRIAALIVSAIQDLRETKGLTPRKIVGYITYASKLPEGQVKRRVKGALRRGVEYGILRKYRGHYFLPVGDEVDRANRIAIRFSRLPSPQRASAKSRNHRKKLVARDCKKACELANKSENSVAEGTRPRKSRSLPFSTTMAKRSFGEKPQDDDVSAE